ncbi:hypothetical protein V865_007450 [Kwoniella europaea PYCC6329]|uniref:Uncharacterized protein n=1 Tax=Kwoniella europaea PYCC6329 TaxID=1423913 RepID=A0AAX4KSV7_9TREE
MFALLTLARPAIAATLANRSKDYEWLQDKKAVAERYAKTANKPYAIIQHVNDEGVTSPVTLLNGPWLYSIVYGENKNASHVTARGTQGSFDLSNAVIVFPEGSNETLAKRADWTFDTSVNILGLQVGVQTKCDSNCKGVVIGSTLLYLAYNAFETWLGSGTGSASRTDTENKRKRTTWYMYYTMQVANEYDNQWPSTTDVQGVFWEMMVFQDKNNLKNYAVSAVQGQAHSFEFDTGRVVVDTSFCLWPSGGSCDTPDYPWAIGSDLGIDTTHDDGKQRICYGQPLFDKDNGELACNGVNY